MISAAELELKPLALGDRDLFERAFARLTQRAADYSFVSLMLVASAAPTAWTICSGHLCVFVESDDELTLIIPPLPVAAVSPDARRDCLRRCFSIMDAYNAPRLGLTHSRIYYVTEELRALHAEVFPLRVLSHLDDYVYSTERIAHLRGRALSAKRHARTRFMRGAPLHTTEPLADPHVAAAAALLDVWSACRAWQDERWGEVRGEIRMDTARSRMVTSTRYALLHWRELDMRGRVARVGDRVVAFTLGTRLTEESALVLIELTHPDFPGAAEYIFSESCRNDWAAFPQCNVGDDIGYEGIAQAKRSYRPIGHVRKYVLTQERPR